MAKVLVSLDDVLLGRIDRAAKAAGLTRSAYIARLAERGLGMRSGPGRRATVRHALDGLRALAERNGIPGGSTRAIRAERDAR